MALAMLLPSVFPKWFTPAGDAVLSGGSLEFYEVGTTTPKSVYADYQRAAAIGSIVVLDGAGDATIFLGDGGYKVILKDALGAQLDLVDGVFGSGNVFSVDSTASFAFLKTYDEVRALTKTADVIYVCGRETEADGGEGLFQLRPGVTAHDDDGIFLSSVGGSVEYRRVFDAAIDPRWYGVKYGVSDDQKARLEACFPGSAETGMPILVAKQITVTQNVTVPIAAVIECLHDGFFYAANSVSMVFEAGSRFSGVETCFQGGIQPTFAAGTIEDLYLSWFYGTDSTTWARALASTTAKVAFRMDKATSVTSSVTIPANLTLEPENGAVLTFGALGDLSIGSLGDVGYRQFIAYGSDAYIGGVSIASPVCYMEWFGGSAANDGNANAIPFRACCAARRLDLQAGPLNYTVTNTNPFTVSDFVTWVGNGSKITLNQAVTFLGIYLNDITVFGSGSITHSSCVATKTTSIVPLLVGPTSATDSNLISVAWVTKAIGSNISSPGRMDGHFDGTTVSSSASIQVGASLWIDGCRIQKYGTTPAFIFADDVTEAVLTACRIESEGALFYSASPALVVTLKGCKNDEWSNGQAIHNGIATVHASGCGFVRNSSVNSIDGVDLDSANMIKIGTDSTPVVFSSVTTPWRAPVPLSSDGTYIVTGENMALSSDPYTTQTIRAIAFATFDAAWRYGGVIDVDVVFPTGTTPDPDKRIGMMFALPPTANVATVGVNAIGDGGKFCCNPVILGVAPWVRMPAKEAAPMRCAIPVWGGQIDMRATPEVHPTYTVADIWGDKSTSVPSETNTLIPEFGRLVLYGVDDGVLIPAGTKIKASFRPVLPKTAQYEKFFPDHKPFQHISSDYYMFAPASYQAIRIRTSLTGSGLGQTQLAVPFMYRDGDYNGVQASLARKATDNVSAVQWNGSTLAVGWS